MTISHGASLVGALIGPRNNVHTGQRRRILVKVVPLVHLPQFVREAFQLQLALLLLHEADQATLHRRMTREQCSPQRTIPWPSGAKFRGTGCIFSSEKCGRRTVQAKHTASSLTVLLRSLCPRHQIGLLRFGEELTRVGHERDAVKRIQGSCAVEMHTRISSGLIGPVLFLGQLLDAGDRRRNAVVNVVCRLVKDQQIYGSRRRRRRRRRSRRWC
mmetsp:Transcript_3622/g.8743  ORF Transcript_3622/g.8743 Transcript_3622/m.8743 type:complete len:215 (-) Transcript_3622:128-772(-)